jgi:hypothetical protein
MERSELEPNYYSGDTPHDNEAGTKAYWDFVDGTNAVGEIFYKYYSMWEKESNKATRLEKEALAWQRLAVSLTVKLSQEGENK